MAYLDQMNVKANESDTVGTDYDLRDKDLNAAAATTSVGSTQNIVLKGTDGSYHTIDKSSFTEAVRGVLGGILNNMTSKGTAVKGVGVIDNSNDFGLTTPSDLASVLGENESIITVTATEIASKNKPGIYYVTDDPGTGVYIPVGCSFVLVRKIYSNRSIQIAFNTWSYDGNKVFFRRSDDNNSFAGKAWIRNYDEGILTDSTIMSSLASALGAAQAISITSASVVDNLADGLYGYVGGVDFGIGIKAGVIEVTSYGGYKIQKVTTYDSGSNETWTRVWNNSWSNWSRLDNFGCNTLSSLASALGVIGKKYDITDFNNVEETGIYFSESPSASHSPATGNSAFGILLVMNFGIYGSVFQIFFDYNYKIHMRITVNYEWEAWKTVALT